MNLVEDFLAWTTFTTLLAYLLVLSPSTSTLCLTLSWTKYLRENQRGLLESFFCLNLSSLTAQDFFSFFWQVTFSLSIGNWIFSFLGTGMLQCVPPFLSQKLVEHLMKNYIKAFLATGIGLAMMKLVAEVESEKIKVSHDLTSWWKEYTYFFLRVTLLMCLSQV